MNSALDYAGNEKRPLKNQTKNWLKEQGVQAQDIASIRGRVVHKAGANGLSLAESQVPELDTSLSEVKKYFKAERQINHKTAQKNQAIRIKQNFANNELDPLNPQDWQKANDLGVELMEKAYPDYKAAVYTHLDSQKHQLHNHIIMSRVNTYTGKKFKDVHAGDSAERFKNINDKIAQQQGWNILPRHKAMSVRKVQRDLAKKQVPSYVSAIQEQALNSVLIAENRSLTDFKEDLNNQGVDVLENKKGNLSFHWTDTDNKQRQVRGKRMGTLFNAPNLTKILALSRPERLAELKRQGVSSPPVTWPTRRNGVKLATKTVEPKEETAERPQTQATTAPQAQTEQANNNNLVASLLHEDAKENTSTERKLSSDSASRTDQYGITEIMQSIDEQTNNNRRTTERLRRTNQASPATARQRVRGHRENFANTFDGTRGRRRRQQRGITSTIRSFSQKDREQFAEGIARPIRARIQALESGLKQISQTTRKLHARLNKSLGTLGAFINSISKIAQNSRRFAEYAQKQRLLKAQKEKQQQRQRAHRSGPRMHF